MNFKATKKQKKIIFAIAILFIGFLSTRIPPLVQSFIGLSENTQKISAEGVDKAKVVRVVDGDTILVNLNGKSEKVRLLGINSPESVDPNRPVEFYGEESSAYTKASVSGKVVYLGYDVEKRDQYGRLLAYVWLTPSDKLEDTLNAELISKGYAKVVTFQPNTRHTKLFTALERVAKKEKLGLWGDNHAH